MGQNMGRMGICEYEKIFSNFLTSKQKKSSENRMVFGTFMVAEAGVILPDWVGFG